MRAALLLWVLCALAAAVHDGLYDPESPVAAFTDTTLPRGGEKADGRFALVEYYSAWCGHCQRFKPEYEETARKAKVALPSLIVGAMNCPSYSDTCEEAGVSKFPTMVLYTPNGASHEYKGSKPTADDIITWAMKFTPTADSAAAVHAAAHAAAAHAAAGGLVSQRRSNESSAELMSLRPRQMPTPVPTADVISAARQSLIEVGNARLGASKQANSELANSESHKDQLGALLGWLRALHYQLPRDSDGGATAASAAELQAMLHGRLSLPKRAEWLQMLERVNAGAAAEPPKLVGCSSANPQLHGYPCSLWLLFHALIEHSSEGTALTTLDAIIGYVVHFFGCEECATHFAAMAATREYSIRTMAERGGRERAALWLWHAHNVVNTRLAAAAKEGTGRAGAAAAAALEFSKEPWPSRADCGACHQVTLSRHGGKPSVGWDRKAVLRHLSSAFCLEPRFECWEELQARIAAPPLVESQTKRATWVTLATMAAFLLLACGCCYGGGKKKKADHIV